MLHMKNIKFYLVLITIFFAGCSPKQITKTTEVDFRSQAPAPGPAPVIQLKKPASFILNNGLKVLVVENHKLPTVDMDLFLDYPQLVEKDKAGMLEFFGPMMKAGTKNFTKEALDEELDFHGIQLGFGARGLNVSTLKKKLPKAMELMSEVLFNPTFNNETELNKFKKQAITGLSHLSKDSDGIMGQVKNAVMYGKDHPWGEYATEDSYKAISLSDFSKHYNTYFKPNVGYLTIVGDITLDEARSLANKHFSNWKKGNIASIQYNEPKNLSKTEIVVVDLPTATQSNISISNLQDLKKANKDYFGTVLGNHILGGSSFSRLFKNLREDKGYTYGAYSSLSNHHKMPSTFSASLKVRNEVTDSAVVEVMKELKRITASLPSDELETAKKERTGRFALGLEDPATIARYARTILRENLDDDFYSNYLKSLNGLSTNDVMAAMDNYVKPDNARIFIVGKATEIVPGLKKLGYPIRFYDMWANEVADPTIKADLGEVTAESVVNKYLKAIGGREKLESIGSMIQEIDLEIPGLPGPASGVIKIKTPDKMTMTMSAEGIGQLMRMVFNKDKGFMEQMGQKVDMGQAELVHYLNRNLFVEELDLDPANMKLDNKITENNREYYKIIVTEENGTNERFYDAETGLLAKVISVYNIGEQQDVTSFMYKDYTDFDGILLPKSQVTSSMGQEFGSTITKVTFNSGVEDADFE